MNGYLSEAEDILYEPDGIPVRLKVCFRKKQVVLWHAKGSLPDLFPEGFLLLFFRVPW